MVGIEAGTPSLPGHDIPLGDIAVNIPQDRHPGVLQYNFGKYEMGEKFVLTALLDVLIHSVKTCILHQGLYYLHCLPG
jgi:hypothetical protein